MSDTTAAPAVRMANLTSYIANWQSWPPTLGRSTARPRIGFKSFAAQESSFVDQLLAADRRIAKSSKADSSSPEDLPQIPVRER